MVENQDLPLTATPNQLEIDITPKRGRGRPRKPKIPKEKKPLGRPKLHPKGFKEFRDSQHKTLIDRKRLSELLEIEEKYLMMKLMINSNN